MSLDIAGTSDLVSIISVDKRVRMMCGHYGMPAFEDKNATWELTVCDCDRCPERHIHHPAKDGFRCRHLFGAKCRHAKRDI